MSAPRIEENLPPEVIVQLLDDEDLVPFEDDEDDSDE